MTRWLLLALVLTILLVPAPTATAAPGNPAPKWGAIANPSQCTPNGELVVNAIEKVVNSVDSGEGGNNWAFINYNKSIQVWAQEDGTFCVRVIYLGRFQGVAGQISPGAGGILSGTEKGSFEGGYWATVTGTLKSAPGWTTNGLAANTDHQCAISGICPGAVSWLEQYFEPGYGFVQTWWGWTYHGGKNGSWVNSVDGNSGDILGS